MVASCLQNMSNRVIRAIARSAFMVGFPHLCLFTGGSPYESDMRKQRKVLKCFWSKVQSIPIGTNNLLVAELDDFTIQFLLWFWAVSTWLTTCYNHCHSGALDLVRNMSNRFKLPDLTKLFGIMLVECWTCVYLGCNIFLKSCSCQHPFVLFCAWLHVDVQVQYGRGNR